MPPPITWLRNLHGLRVSPETLRLLEGAMAPAEGEVRLPGVDWSPQARTQVEIPREILPPQLAPEALAAGRELEFRPREDPLAPLGEDLRGTVLRAKLAGDAVGRLGPRVEPPPTADSLETLSRFGFAPLQGQQGLSGALGFQGELLPGSEFRSPSGKSFEQERLAALPEEAPAGPPLPDELIRLDLLPLGSERAPFGELTGFRDRAGSVLDPEADALAAQTGEIAQPLRGRLSPPARRVKDWSKDTNKRLQGPVGQDEISRLAELGVLPFGRPEAVPGLDYDETGLLRRTPSGEQVTQARQEGAEALLVPGMPPLERQALERGRISGVRVAYPELLEGKMPPEAQVSPEASPASGAPVHFVSTSPGPERILSNFAPTPVMLDGVQYPTVEHAYQAAKFPHHQREAIRRAATPAAARSLGRQISAKIRRDWDAVKEQVMRDLLQQKFAPGTDAHTFLVSTGTRPLLHTNTFGDRVWGVDPQGAGENRLGRILEDLRRSPTGEEPPTPPPPPSGPRPLRVYDANTGEAGELSPAAIETYRPREAMGAAEALGISGQQAAREMQLAPDEALTIARTRTGFQGGKPDVGQGRLIRGVLPEDPEAAAGVRMIVPKGSPFAAHPRALVIPTRVRQPLTEEEAKALPRARKEKLPERWGIEDLLEWVRMAPRADQDFGNGEREVQRLPAAQRAETDGPMRPFDPERDLEAVLNQLGKDEAVTADLPGIEKAFGKRTAQALQRRLESLQRREAPPDPDAVELAGSAQIILDPDSAPLAGRAQLQTSLPATQDRHQHQATAIKQADVVVIYSGGALEAQQRHLPKHEADKRAKLQGEHLRQTMGKELPSSARPGANRFFFHKARTAYWAARKAGKPVLLNPSREALADALADGQRAYVVVEGASDPGRIAALRERVMREERGELSPRDLDQRVREELIRERLAQVRDAQLLAARAGDAALTPIGRARLDAEPLLRTAEEKALKDDDPQLWKLRAASRASLKAIFSEWGPTWQREGFEISGKPEEVRAGVVVVARHPDGRAIALHRNKSAGEIVHSEIPSDYGTRVAPWTGPPPKLPSGVKFLGGIITLPDGRRVIGISDDSRVVVELGPKGEIRAKTLLSDHFSSKETKIRQRVTMRSRREDPDAPKTTQGNISRRFTSPLWGHSRLEIGEEVLTPAGPGRVVHLPAKSTEVVVELAQPSRGLPEDLQPTAPKVGDTVTSRTTTKGVKDPDPRTFEVLEVQDRALRVKDQLTGAINWRPRREFGFAAVEPEAPRQRIIRLPRLAVAHAASAPPPRPRVESVTPYPAFRSEGTAYGPSPVATKRHGRIHFGNWHRPAKTPPRPEDWLLREPQPLPSIGESVLPGTITGVGDLPRELGLQELIARGVQKAIKDAEADGTDPTLALEVLRTRLEAEVDLPPARFQEALAQGVRAAGLAADQRLQRWVRSTWDQIHREGAARDQADRPWNQLTEEEKLAVRAHDAEARGPQAPPPAPEDPSLIREALADADLRRQGQDPDEPISRARARGALLSAPLVAAALSSENDSDESSSETPQVAQAGFFSRASRPQRTPAVPSPSFQAAEDARATTPERPSQPLGEQLEQFALNTRAHLDRHALPETSQETANILHGRAGRAIADFHPLEVALDEATAAGIEPFARELLDVQRGLFHWQQHEQRLAEVSHRVSLGDPGAMAELLDLTKRMADGEITQGKLTRAELEARQAELLRELSPEQQAVAQRVVDTATQVSAKILEELAPLLPPDLVARFRGNGYLPGHRLLDEVKGTVLGNYSPDAKGVGAKMGLSADKVVKQLQGSSASMRDPVEDIRWTLELAVKERAINDATQLYLEDFAASGTLGRKLGPGEHPGPGEAEMSYLVAGEPQRFAVPQITADVMKLLHEEQMTPLLNAFRRMGVDLPGVTQLFSNMVASANPAFAALQAPLDFITATTLPRYQMSFRERLPQMARDWANLIREEYAIAWNRQPWTPGHEDFLRSEVGLQGISGLGRLQGYHFKPPSDASLLRKGLYRTQQLSDLVLQPVENATKRMTLNQLRREGGRPETALRHEARTYGGTPDLAGGGLVGRNAVVRTFTILLNAQIKGIEQGVRGYLRDPEKLTRHMGGFAVAVGLLEAWNRTWAGPDWNDFSRDEQDTSLMLVVPGTKETLPDGRTRPVALKLPFIPQAMRWVTQPIQAAIRAGMGQVSPGQALFDSVEGVMPGGAKLSAQRPAQSLMDRGVSMLAPPYRWAVEAAGTGRDAFTGTPIVGARNARLVTPLQYSASTSPTARLAGQLAEQAGVELSPDLIDHGLRSLLPGLGELLRAPVDAGARALIGPEITGREGWSTQDLRQLPGVGPFARRFLPSPISQRAKDAREKLSREGEDAQRAQTTLNRLAERAAIAPGGREALEARKGELSARAKHNTTYTAISRNLAEIARMREAIRLHGGSQQQLQRLTELEMQLLGLVP